MPKHIKNPAAVMLGRLGGLRTSPAKKAAAKRASEIAAKLRTERARKRKEEGVTP